MRLPLYYLIWSTIFSLLDAIPATKVVNSNEAGQIACSIRLTWEKPSDTLSILLIIGGDVVLKALAQLSGRDIVPVAFSFGWVSYSFNTLMSIAGDGRLMPEPDRQAKVINIVSGAIRENRSWVLGRLFRDFERALPDRIGLNVTVYRTCTSGDERVPGVPTWDWCYTSGILTITAQLGIAAIPCGLHGNWAILLITAAGTALALLTGALPQWRLEKYACQRNRRKAVALTGGNGTRSVMVIIDDRGVGLDLEDLAGAESPMLRRQEQFHRGILVGLPASLWVTQVACLILAVLWILFLITVTALDQDPWYLLTVGGLGMLQNVVAAGVRRAPGTSGIHLQQVESFQCGKVMDTLMDVEDAYAGVGRALLDEFFPNDSLRPDEVQWWKGTKSTYEERRKQRRPSFEPLVPGVSPEIPTLRTDYKNTFRSNESSPKLSLSPDMAPDGRPMSEQLVEGDASLFAYSGWIPI